MRAPVEAVSSGKSVRACRDKMYRLSVDCLPVQRDGRVVGVIGRWDAEKAVEHRLGQKSVAHFMSTPAIKVRPGTSLLRMQRLLMDHGIDHLPVLGPEGLVGMVSGEDILRAWPAGDDIEAPVEMFSAEVANLADMMRQRFSPKVLRVLRNVGHFGQSVGVEVFLVGGSVRDMLMGLPDVDLDIVVIGDGIAFARKYVAQHGGRIVSYRRFATAMMILPGGLKIDVVSARSEQYEHPGALPVVAPGALIHDLYRRDFTINSMALRLSGADFGRLVDPFGGRRDLKRRIVRVMHNLSFVEDPTRIIRAVRFEGRYGFHMDARSLYLLKVAAREHLLDAISGQRLREEILILMRERKPLPAILRLDRLGVWKSLSSQLRVTKELIGRLVRIDRHLNRWEDLWSQGSLERWIVFLLGLFSDLTDSQMEILSERLCLHRKARECLRQAHRVEANVFEELGAPHRPANARLYQILHPLSAEVLIYLMARSARRAVVLRIIHYLVRLRPITLDIGGKDLRKLGLAPGVVYGRILDQVLVAKLNGQLRSRAEELRLAAKLAQTKKR